MNKDQYHIGNRLTAKEFQDKIKSGEIGVGAKGNLVSQAIDSQIPQRNMPGMQFKRTNKYNAKTVDINLQQIPSVKEWRKTHPDDIYFDSMIEGQFYYYLKENNIDFKLKHKIVLQEKFKYLTKNVSAITWTPDYLLVDPVHTIIIDTKGYPDASFALKYRMILNYLNGLRIEKPHIWFVSSKKKFPIALNCIRRVQQGKELDGIEASLIFGYKPKKKKK